MGTAYIHESITNRTPYRPIRHAHIRLNTNQSNNRPIRHTPGTFSAINPATRLHDQSDKYASDSSWRSKPLQNQARLFLRSMSAI